MKKNLIIGCMAVFAVSVQAQEGWTLRQCIDYAIEHNISTVSYTHLTLPTT